MSWFPELLVQELRSPTEVHNRSTAGEPIETAVHSHRR